MTFGQMTFPVGRYAITLDREQHGYTSQDAVDRDSVVLEHHFHEVARAQGVQHGALHREYDADKGSLVLWARAVQAAERFSFSAEIIDRSVALSVPTLHVMGVWSPLL